MARIQRAVARDVAQAPTPDPEAYGAAEGRALQQVGQAVGAVGNVVQLGARALDGYHAQLARARGLEAADHLQRAAEAELRNPDFADRERSFLQRVKEIRDEFGGGLTPRRRADFEAIVSRARNEHSRLLRASTIRDEADAAESLVNETLRRASIRAATATNTVDRLAAIQVGTDALDEFAVQFGVPDHKRDESIEDFRRSVSDSMYVERLRVDPVDAYRLLEHPDAGLAHGRTELERQQMLTHALGEIESRLSRDNQREAQEYQRSERERRQAAFDAGVAIVEAGTTEAGVSIDQVYEFAEVLGEAKTRELVQWVADTGGKIRRKENDPRVFEALMARAKSGEYIGDDVITEQLAGNLDQSARNALLSESQSVRFGPADDYLNGLISPMAGSPVERERQGMARMLFSIWKAENQNASMSDAFQAAQEMAERARVFDTSKVRIAQFPPKLGVYEADNRTLKRAETENAYTRALLEGRIEQDEYDRELDLVERYMRAQEAEQRRAAERNQP